MMTAIGNSFIPKRARYYYQECALAAGQHHDPENKIAKMEWMNDYLDQAVWFIRLDLIAKGALA